MIQQIYDIQDWTVLELVHSAKKLSQKSIVSSLYCPLLLYFAILLTAVFITKLSSPRSYAGPTVVEDKFGGKTENLPALPPFKQPWSVNESSSISSSTPRSSTSSLFFNSKKSKSGAVTQMKLCGNAINPNAPACMDVAIANFIHSHCLPFSLAGDPKFMKIIEEARNLGPSYTPPDRHDIGGKLP
jgi:hypothetical protein